MSFVLRVGTLALAWLLIGPVTPAWSGAPTDQLRGSIDRVLAIVNDPALQAPARAAERNAALRAALEARVDAARAARETLGLYWRDRTPQEQEQFTGLFRELLERTYMARIEAHAGAHVQYVGESVDGEYATVRTLIVARESPTVPVDYQLFRRGDQWLVYDILIEHVSLVDNYRSQFRDIIATSSYANLVKRIETKLAELRAQNPLLSLAPLSAQPRRAATSPQRYIVCRPTAGA